MRRFGKRKLSEIAGQPTWAEIIKDGGTARVGKTVSLVPKSSMRKEQNRVVNGRWPLGMGHKGGDSFAW